ncbi:unnamed protein product [Polarella glacialis]|uniref:Uncharacterized protein n=1 Tax=Polarella glacialis TaxID=89957 RepID=A0A813LVT7_POLGL|nr:unnamed protein product [Polarella glacialis]
MAMGLRLQSLVKQAITGIDRPELDAGGKKAKRGVTTDIIRHTAHKYTGGRSDLIPEEIDDPELVIRALVRKLHGEASLFEKQRDIADSKASTFQRSLDLSKEENETNQEAMQKLTKELKVAQRELVGYQSKIAYLGERWEKLTGQLNEELDQNSESAAKLYKGELRVARSEVFGSNLKVISLQKEIAVLRQNIIETEARCQIVETELVRTRLKDEEILQENIQVEQKVNNLKKDMITYHKTAKDREEDAKVAEKKEKETKVKLTEETRRAFASDKVASDMTRVVSITQMEIRAVGEKAREAAENSQFLEDSVVYWKGRLTQANASLFKEAARHEVSKSQTKRIERRVERLLKENQSLEQERDEFRTRARLVERETIGQEKRAKEAENQAKELTTTMVTGTEMLVKTEVELQAWKDKHAEVAAEIEIHKVDVKEYKELAALWRAREETCQKEVLQWKAEVSEFKAEVFTANRVNRLTKAKLAETEKAATAAGVNLADVSKALQITGVINATEKQKVEERDDVIVGLKEKIESLQDALRIDRIERTKAEEDLANVTELLRDSKERGRVYCVERDRSRSQFAKEEEQVAALVPHVEELSKNIGTEEIKVKEGLKRELALKEEIVKLQVKVKEVSHKADLFEDELGKVTQDRHVIHEEAVELRGSIRGKVLAVRSVREKLDVQVADVAGLKDAHAVLFQNLLESRAQHAAADAEVERLAPELKKTQRRLKDSEKQAVDLQNDIKSLEQKLGDYSLDVYAQKVKAKTLVGDLKQNRVQLHTVEAEVVFTKSSVGVLCNDVADFQAKLRQEHSITAALEGEIQQWQAKLEASQFEVSEVKDTHWRVVQDLEVSQKRQKDFEAAAKKSNTELRAMKKVTKLHEDEIVELTANVESLTEQLIEATKEKGTEDVKKHKHRHSRKSDAQRMSGASPQSRGSRGSGASPASP